MWVNKTFLKHEAVHFLVAGVLALLIYLSFFSPSFALFTFFSGVLIDGDHLFDFWVYWRGIKLSPKAYADLSVFTVTGKAYIPLHSLELWGLVATAYLGGFVPAWGLAISVGALGNILFDQLSFAKHPLSYFLFFRVLKRFDWKKLFKF